MPTSYNDMIDLSDMTDDAVSQIFMDYARGRLSNEDRKSVEAAVSNNPAQREELEYYKGLAKAHTLPGDQNSPGELGWARLSKAIEAEEKATTAHLHAANSNQPPHF